MGRPLSLTMADIHMIRTKHDVVKLLKSVFYKRYMIYGRRKKNSTDHLYHELSNYHLPINLTIEINLKEFLDTQVRTKNGKIKNTVYRKCAKLSVPWSSSISKRCKPNAVNTDLHCSKLISTNFD